jgi:CBS-domain-containing membrane protein
MNYKCIYMKIILNKQTPRPESASELYRPSDRHLSAKLVPIFADRGCHVVSVTDFYGRILGFLDCKDNIIRPKHVIEVT